MRCLLEFALLPPLFSLLLLSFSAGVKAEQNAVLDVGLILDSGSTLGKITLTSVNMSLSDFYRTYPNSTTRLRIHARDSANDVVDAASAGFPFRTTSRVFFHGFLCFFNLPPLSLLFWTSGGSAELHLHGAIDLIQNDKIQAIVGPQTSTEAVFLADLGSRSCVPVVSFTATSPSVSPKEKPYFVRAAPSDGSQAKPIAAVVRAFGWKRVVVVYEDTCYGSGSVPSLFDALQEVEARVPYVLALSPSASDDKILQELFKLQTMQTRIFVVHMGTPLASRFFPLAEEAEMMGEGFAWIITHGLAELLDTVDSAVIDSMAGVVAVKPYVSGSKALEEFKKRWRRNFLLENPESNISGPTAVGLRAYDAIWALATAVESVGNVAARYVARETADISGDMGRLGTSVSGPKILEAILNSTFEGLSGKFRLIDGEIRSPEYEVVNLIGRSQRTVGFWTSSGGLSRYLYGNSRRKAFNSAEDLLSIIWPGESTVPPRGWEDPQGEKKIIVGVPKESGFDLMMKTDYDPLSKATIPSGFVIEVFEEAVKRLPYAVPLKYVAYDGDYDSLVNQITLQKFDAVVGDITVTYDRSKLVDFTLPYTERGVAMVVPVKDQREANGWIFLQPMELALWVVAGAFFVFTGAVVWVLEHRVNNGFRGPRSTQIGSAFYFAFSTLVFAHREKLVSNLSRAVVIVWLFVVLVLTSSYTASLASMFTVRRLQPKHSDISELRKNGEFVGYPEKSFVLKVLKEFGFHESQLKPYVTEEDFEMALARGSANGGVSAIVDEIPYLRVFLKDRCSRYAITNLIYNTEGFGFAFPMGSPLVVDISRSILNMTDGNKILEIEKRWFGEYKDCPEDSDISHNILDFKNFWGLFLVTGVASTSSLFFFFVSFLRRNWQKLNGETSGMSLRQKLFAVFELVQRLHLRHTAGSVTKNSTTGFDPGSPLSISANSFHESPSLDLVPTPFKDR